MLHLSCFTCCPILVGADNRRTVANASTQSDSVVAVATIVFANDEGAGQGQVGQRQVGQRQVDQVVVSRFVNAFPSALAENIIFPSQRNSMLLGSENREDTPSPPPPPPSRNKDLTNPIPVAENLQLNMSQGNSEGERSDSPPPPPPPREQPPSSPLPEINPKILSPGFMGIGPSDPQTGDRLNTIEVPKQRPLTSVEAAGENPGKASQLVGVNQKELWV
jgi:hypothetical protein